MACCGEYNGNNYIWEMVFKQNKKLVVNFFLLLSAKSWVFKAMSRLCNWNLCILSALFLCPSFGSLIVQVCSAAATIQQYKKDARIFFFFSFFADFKVLFLSCSIAHLHFFPPVDGFPSGFTEKLLTFAKPGCCRISWKQGLGFLSSFSLSAFYGPWF